MLEAWRPWLTPTISWNTRSYYGPKPLVKPLPDLDTAVISQTLL